MARDPIRNFLPLAYLYQPLFRFSDVYAAIKKRKVVGVCTVFKGYANPTVHFEAITQETKKELLKFVLERIEEPFNLLCDSNDVKLLRQIARLESGSMRFQQMVTRSPRRIKTRIKVTRVKRKDLSELNRFYETVEAWLPIHFETGPYYCIKVDGKIVSAAGVRFVTPQIANVANVFTDEAYRNRGFATACTSTLAWHLASTGRIVTLLVEKDNAPAIHIYEKLGFKKVRNISLMFNILHK
jgi:ribosomal protein S18 acetylase RimI-like enzyme